MLLLKCLEITLSKGQILHIPAYWWYSIKYNSKLTTLCTFKYMTYMNSIAIFPKLFMRLLQLHNVKRQTARVAKQVSLSKPNHKEKNK